MYLSFYLYASLRRMIKTPRYRFLLLITTCLATVVSLSYANMIGLVHGSSTLLFFVAISLAEFDTSWLKLIHAKYPVLLTYALMFGLIYWLRHNAEWIHLLGDYFVILSLIVMLSSYNVNIKALPRWLGGCSYDIYLVHNKALMLLKPIYTVVPLWAFIGLSSMFTIAFFTLRKLLRL